MASGSSPAPGSLAAFMTFVLRHARLVALVTGLFTLAGLGGWLFLPREYTAHTVLLPQEGSGGGLLSMAASMMGGGSALAQLGAGLAADPELMIQEGVLHSDRLSDEIDREFDLAKRYGADNRDRRLQAWHKRLDSKTNKQGLLVVSVTDRDRDDAALILTRVIEYLDMFNREIRLTRSRRTRVFVEERLGDARIRLAEIEAELVDYQADNRSLALSPTTEAVMIAGADLLSERIRLQMEVRTLERSLSPDSPMVRERRARMEALDNELSRLPRLHSELGRLLREQRVREQTYGFLSAQLEELRIDEARDTPTVDILDAPRPPDEASFPRFYLVILALVGGFLLALVLAWVGDSWREARERETAA